MSELPAAGQAVAERLASLIAGVTAERLPPAVRERCRDLVLDVAGLCLAARHEPYVRALTDTADGDGPCTAFGHQRRVSAGEAALINGTAAHGEDFDDTFEGGPVHAGAVIVPTVLAAAERYGRDGDSVLVGIAVGVETVCRLSLVTPQLVHRAGFHPTAVLGTMAAAAAAGATLGLGEREIVSALGVAGSMASGIIEYLAEGAWTKRLHPGWSAQAGLRAALAAHAGFVGPRTVFEGVHGFFHGFAHKTDGDYGALLDDFGRRWVTETIAFKPYACGTMNHPYIDCARRLAATGVRADDIEEITCEVAHGIVHRLWEPLADKQRPPNGYAGKFSGPFCIAVAFHTGDAGLGAFTDERARNPQIRKLAAKIRFEVDPKNPYPNEFTGHLRARLRDGRVIEERQPYLRGGAHEPLPRADLEAKFKANAAYGGWSATESATALEAIGKLFRGPVDLAVFRR
jgi:2-methylcitrate dehydratase PrpD